MTTYGFGSGGTVWLDIEAYSYTSSTCKAAVDAYVNGWDSILTPLSDSGVYGSAVGSAVSASSTLTYKPNFVWIADTSDAPNSVWGIPAVSNSLWVDDQRVHQYRTNKSSPYPSGCTGSSGLHVDVDCVDTWVDGPNLPFDDETSEPAESSSPTGDASCNSPSQ